MKYFDLRKIDALIEERFRVSGAAGEKIKDVIHQGLLEELMATMVDELSVYKQALLAKKIKTTMSNIASYSHKLPLFLEILNTNLQQEPVLLEKFAYRAEQYITNEYVQFVRRQQQ